MSNKHRYKPEIQRILETGGHRTADQVLSKLRKTYLLVGKGTVYRSLQELVDEWIAMKTPGVIDKMLFESAKAPHGHLVCKASGKIVDVAIDAINLDLLDMPEDFQIDQVSVRVDGMFEWHEWCSLAAKIQK